MRHQNLPFNRTLEAAADRTDVAATETFKAFVQGIHPDLELFEEIEVVRILIREPDAGSLLARNHGVGPGLMAFALGRQLGRTGKPTMMICLG